MKTREDLALQLFTTRLMTSDAEVELFEEALHFLFVQEKIENIPLFLSVLDDRTEKEEVMYGILHAIESYASTLGFPKYVETLLDAMDSWQEQAEEWQELLFLRMINNEACFADLVRIVSLQKKEELKKHLQLIFLRIMQRNEIKFGQQCRLLLNALD
ncbi:MULTISPECIES: Imm30 family immunity protein [unclassified Myroides]|uniref:Imm30 family immunity protein n=1 Tax=unclassified Myroides TaxID=2642485 RepID=UPI003D2F8BEE